MKPEEQARLKIDELLEQAGWVVQDRFRLNLDAARGVAVREFSTLKGARAFHNAFWPHRPKRQRTIDLVHQSVEALRRQKARISLCQVKAGRSDRCRDLRKGHFDQ